MNKVFIKVMLFYYVLTSPLRKKRESRYKNFLIIDTLRLGDVVMSTPVFKAIKEKYPDSKLSVLVRAKLTAILDGNPHIDEIIPYHGKDDNILLIKNLRKKCFDICINLCEGKLNNVVYASRIPVRIGYIQRHKYRDRFFLTDPIRWAGDFEGTMALFLRLLEPLGIFNANNNMELYLSRQDIDSVKQFLPNDKIKIVIHPGSRGSTKRWPYYKELTNEIIKKLNAVVILTGDKTETSLVEKIADNFDSNAVLNLGGKISIKQLVALCSLANVVVGNDTSVLHIARALGVPNITIFGPEDPKLAGSLNDKSIQIFKDVPCKPDTVYFGISIKGVRRCKKEICESHMCMKDITPDMVLEKIQELLKK